MCNSLKDDWVHCQPTHMELQSQSNSTGIETVQDELQQSELVFSCTQYDGVLRCFHWGCGSKGCCQHNVLGASDS